MYIFLTCWSFHSFLLLMQPCSSETLLHVYTHRYCRYFHSFITSRAEAANMAIFFGPFEAPKPQHIALRDGKDT